MLTPARNANSRWRASPPVTGSMGWPSGRIAQAPARSFEVMMIEETPSPARAGRFSASSTLSVGVADPELARIETADEVLEQIERLGQHVVLGDRLEVGDVE